MRQELNAGIILANSKQQANQTARVLLARMRRSNQLPCFVVAPRRCGQEELLKTFLAEFAAPVEVTFIEIGEAGECRVVRRSRSSELLPRVPPRTESLPLDERKVKGSTGETGEPRKPRESLELRENLEHRERLALLAFVPWLEDESAKHLSDEIDALIQQGYFVLAFCPPQNDRYHNLQSDRMEISARELMSSGYFQPKAYTDSLKRFINEFLPLQIRLAAVLAAILGRFTLEDLQRLGYSLSPDIPQLLAELHPIFSTTDCAAAIKAEPVSLRHLEQEIFQVIGEQLKAEGLQPSTSVLASRITMLSITLLEKGDLENSHQILEIAEGLVKRETAPESYPYSSGAFQSADSRLARSQADIMEPLLPHLNYAPKANVPPIKLRLFGKLDVSMNGVSIRNKHLSRTKIRRFLAYLVLNQPRVVSRESLVEYLWPYLDAERAQKNLYTSWFMLARGLGSERVRDCPYLLRNGEIYQLNPELVLTDVEQFETLVRTVLFGKFNLDDHTRSILELEVLYKDSLVADIPADSFISAKMAAFRSKMVDVLLLETRQLRTAGEVEKALFCVQSAYELDETREDVFRELMDTQFEAGQRTMAMQTYFSCKQYLADELGILPSKRTTALYQDLLLDNCH